MNRLVTTYGIDNRGRVLTTTDPKNQTESVQLDILHGQIAKTINKLGWETDLSYDDWRRQATVIDFNDRSSITSYDQYSRVTQIVEPPDSPASPTLKVTYDQAARPATVTVERRLDGTDYSRSTQFVDGFGRAVLERSLSPNVGENWATADTFDSLGRSSRTSVQFAISAEDTSTHVFPNWGTMPQFTETEYDDLSRPFNVRTRKGTNATTGELGNIWLEKYRYSKFDVRYSDRKNYRTDTRSDGLGRTVSVSEIAAGTGGADITASYSYNSANDLLSVVAPDSATTTIGYDLVGRKVTMNDPDTGTWSYDYDANSNLRTQTEPIGATTTTDHDALDRPIERKIDGVVRATWAYDGAGELGSLTESTQANGGVQRFEYDGSTGRILATETDIANPTGTGLFTFRSAYTLRDNGTTAAMRYPTGTAGQTGDEITYDYNARIGSQTRLTSASEGTIVDSVNWNQIGQLTQRTYGPGGSQGVAEYVYDQHRLWLNESRAGTTADVDAWQRLIYKYDKNGNITRSRDRFNSWQWQCFTYDQIDRLTSAYTDASSDKCDGTSTAGNGEGVFDAAYTYDDAGNILTKTGTGVGTHNGTYAYGDPNQVHAVTATSNGDSYEYDGNGNMEVRNSGGVVQSMSWDPDQRLESVEEVIDSIFEFGTITEFAYDADGRRVRRSSGSVHTYYPTGGSEYTYDDSAGTGVFTHYHQLGGATVAFTTDGETTWMFTDQVSSTALTHSEAGTNRTQRYTPWGETRTSGELETDRTYTGQIEDQTTGLRFFNARYQDPILGRFISPDTVIPSAGNGQDYNRYAYVNNNPINFNDPTGNDPQCVGSGSSCTQYFEGTKITQTIREQSTSYTGTVTPGTRTVRVTAPGEDIGTITSVSISSVVATTIENAVDAYAPIGQAEIRHRGGANPRPTYRNSYPRGSSQRAIRDGVLGNTPRQAAQRLRWVNTAGKTVQVAGALLTVHESYRLSEGGDVTERVLATTGRSSAAISGGLVGGAVGGAGAGLVSGAVCGPGAVVCSPTFAFIGGTVGAIGGTYAGSRAWDWAVDNFVNAPRGSQDYAPPPPNCSFSWVTC